jgi:putative oxidoreductase
MPLDVWAPRVRAILRIVTGIMFMMHGTQKMFGWPIPPHGGQSPPITSIYGVAGIIEIVCGALIAIGLLTRFAAFLASGEMAVAYFMAHAKSSFWPLENQGELAVVYCFLFLYFVFSGAGAWSVDALIDRNRATRRT